MATMNQFCKRNNVAVKTCEMVGENPNAPDWRDAYHYRVTLRARVDGRRSQLTVYFSMGYAHSREPEAAEILDCLASDAASVENSRGFEDWASDLGYDTDSRKAEKTYKVCERQAGKLRNFLGNSEYQDLLWNVERM